jgi:hypothetical protein
MVTTANIVEFKLHNAHELGVKFGSGLSSIFEDPRSFCDPPNVIKLVNC